MRCKAKRRDGKPCGQWAVKGLQVCRMHGAGSPQSKAKRARLEQEAKAAKAAARLTIAVETDPSQALLDAVNSAAGEVAYWAAEVDKVQAEHPRQLTMGVTRVEQGTRDRAQVDVKTIETVPHIAYRMWVDARERLVRYATAALRAGVEERRVRVAEEQGAQLAAVIRAILGDRELDLTAEQAARAPGIAARHLRLIAS